MKKIITITITLSFIFFILCCNKGSLLPTNNGNNNNNNVTPTSTPVGTPTGPSVSKFISSSGGSIATADGRVEIDFPNGALPSGDTITIQNITNNGPNGLGDAYRFLPDGLKFPTAVTIKFHYADSDVNGSIPQLLDIAYQEPSGVWKVGGTVSLDESSKIVSVTTTHFTDWNIFTDLIIKPVPPDNLSDFGESLRINKSQAFAVQYILHILQSNDDDELASPYGGAALAVSSEIIKNWSVNGQINGSTTYGKVVPDNTMSSGNASCTYTAPAQVPSSQNPVAITAQLQNLGTIDKKLGAFTNLSLTRNVKITGDDYSYKVTMIYENDEIDGGLEGYPFKEIDTARFTVTIKNGTDVSIADIYNGASSVTPSKQTDPVSGLTSTLTDPGEEWFVSSGSGQVYNFTNPAAVNLTINLDAGKEKEPSFSRSDGVSIGGYAIGLSQQGFTFNLNDSTQTYTSGDNTWRAVIAPTANH